MKATTVLYSLIAGSILFSLNSVYHTYKCEKYSDALTDISRDIYLESIGSCSDTSCILNAMSTYNIYQKHKEILIERGCHG